MDMIPVPGDFEFIIVNLNPVIKLICLTCKVASPLPLWERDRERGNSLAVDLVPIVHPLPNPLPLRERGC